MTQGYTGYLLNENDRKDLATKFPPKCTDFIGHHVTTEFGVTNESIPEYARSAFIVGYATDGEIEVFVVNINGTTKRRDGRTLHITWSLNRKTRNPVDAHELLKKGFNGIEPMAINLEPAFFPFNR